MNENEEGETFNKMGSINVLPNYLHGKKKKKIQYLGKKADEAEVGIIFIFKYRSHLFFSSSTF